MENFFYGEKFCSDLEDLIFELDLGEEGAIEALDNDWSIEVHESSLEPIVNLNVDWIMGKINEDRWSEDGDEADKVQKLLETIDFSAINEKMPKMYYESRKKFTITKIDLLDY